MTSDIHTHFYKQKNGSYEIISNIFHSTGRTKFMIRFLLLRWGHPTELMLTLSSKSSCLSAGIIGIHEAPPPANVIFEGLEGIAQR